MMCAVCAVPSIKRCSRCRAVAYCGAAHQATHWRKGGHKTECIRLAERRGVRKTARPATRTGAVVDQAIAEAIAVWKQGAVGSSSIQAAYNDSTSMVAAADALEDAGDIAGATAAYREVAERYPHHSSAHRNYGLLLAMRDETLKEAIVEFHTATVICERSMDASTEAVAAVCCLNKVCSCGRWLVGGGDDGGGDGGGDGGRREHHLAECALYDRLCSNLDTMAGVYSRLGRPGEAIATYKRLLRQRPDHANYWCSYASELHDYGDYQSSLEASCRCFQLEASPDSDSILDGASARAQAWLNFAITLRSATSVEPDLETEEHERWERRLFGMSVALHKCLEVEPTNATALGFTEMLKLVDVSDLLVDFDPRGML